MVIKTSTPILPYNLQLQDGEPMMLADEPDWLPEDSMQNKSVNYNFNAIDTHFREDEGIFVDFYRFVYYDPQDRNSGRIAPDCYVAFGVDGLAIERRNGYLIWEVGKPPDVVIEVASETIARNDLTSKRDVYAILDVGEYWLLDPTGGDLYGAPLIGETLVDGEYVRLETNYTPSGEIWIHSPALGLDFYWFPDRPELDQFRVYDPETGEFLRSPRESEAERNIAEAEREAAEVERNAAEAERDTAEAELRFAESERMRERERRMEAEEEVRRLLEQIQRMREPE